MTPLETATNKELIEELQKRCAGTAIVLRLETPKDQDEEDFRYYWSNGTALAIGLTAKMHEYLLRRSGELDMNAGGDIDLSEEGDKE